MDFVLLCADLVAGLCAGAAIERYAASRRAARPKTRLELDRDCEPAFYHPIIRMVEGLYYDSHGAERLARRRKHSQLARDMGWVSVDDCYLLRLASGRFAFQSHRRLLGGETTVEAQLASPEEAATFYFNEADDLYVDLQRADFGNAIEDA